MSARIISSKRDTVTGLKFHHCPKRLCRIDITQCEACNLKEKIEQLQATYRVYCLFPSEGGDEDLGMIPSHAEDGGKDVLKRQDWNVLEPKLDGARCVTVIDEFGAIHAFTRNVDRFGKQKEISSNLPHIQGMYLPLYADSKLDAEILCMVAGDAVGTQGATMSVVGAYPETAIATQEQYGFAHLFIFDVMRVNGVDVTKDQWTTRHAAKKAIVEGIRAALPMCEFYIHLMPSFFTKSEEERDGFFKMFLAEGANIDDLRVPTEGIVLKNPLMRYYDSNAILKCKETVTVDVIVTGWEAGKIGGKWENTIGALLFSIMTPDHELVEVGKVIPGDDAKRAELYALLNGKTSDEIAGLSIIIEIEGQNWTKNYRIRHPRVVRYRPDRSDPNIVDLSKVERK